MALLPPQTRFKPDLNISAQVDRVFATGGEILTGVTATLGREKRAIANADIEGLFLSGKALAIRSSRMKPAGRCIVSGDGGAACAPQTSIQQVACGSLEFSALRSSDGSSAIQKGGSFSATSSSHEAALAILTARKAKKSGHGRRAFIHKTLRCLHNRFEVHPDWRFVVEGISWAPPPKPDPQVRWRHDMNGTIIPLWHQRGTRKHSVVWCYYTAERGRGYLV